MWFSTYYSRVWNVWFIWVCYIDREVFTILNLSHVWCKFAPAPKIIQNSRTCSTSTAYLVSCSTHCGTLNRIGFDQMVIYYCSPNVVFSFSCYSLHIVFLPTEIFAISFLRWFVTYAKLATSMWKWTVLILYWNKWRFPNRAY